MNASARQHLATAKEHLAQGAQYYLKAAEEIIAAQDADSTLTQRQIAEALDLSQSQVSEFLSWYRVPDNRPTPYSGLPRFTGAVKDTQGTKRVLRDAPLEQVRQILDDLPVERQQDIAAEAGHAYHKARQDYRETERSLTPAQHKEREASKAETGQLVDKMAGGFATLGVLGHLEQALEELRELASTNAVPTSMIAPLGKALADLENEYRVVRAMAGLDIDLDEVSA